MGIRYDSLQDMRDGKYGDFEVVKSQDVRNQTVHIVRIPSLSEGHQHRVAIQDDEGVLLGGISRSREDIKANFQNAVEDIRSDRVSEARSYFKDKSGFKPMGKTTTNTGLDALKVFSGGYRFTVDEQDVANDRHQYIARHFDEIRSIVKKIEGRDQVFYSEINNRVDNAVPYANQDSSDAMFSTVVEILENKDVRVHS